MEFKVKKEKKKKKEKATPESSPLSSLLLRPIAQLTHSIFLSTKMVFTNWVYIIVAGAIAVIFWIIFNLFDQLLFFSPVFVFYLPDDAIVNFILSNLTSILLGIVVSMNIYVLRHLGKRLRRISTATSFFSGSTISVLSSTCASCSSLGFLLVSTFGGVGVTASTVLSNYQIPLRLLSIALLIWAYYSIGSKLTKTCDIGYKADKV